MAKKPIDSDPVVKREVERIHDAPVPGENHHHTDEHPAVISATEARGGDPNKVGFTVNWVSVLLVVVVLAIVLFIFLR